MSFLAAKSWSDVFNVDKLDVPEGATHGRFVHPIKGNLIFHYHLREPDVVHRNDYPPTLIPMKLIISNSHWLVDYKVSWFRKVVSYEKL